VPGIVVSPMSSAMQFAAPEQDPLAAGRQLGVDAVVEGYVQIRDGRIRITARLLDTDDGTALWSGNFTEPMNDFFAVQDSLANRIASAVSRSRPLTAQGAWSGYGTLDAVAWQQYAEGRFQLQRRDAEGFRRARALFEAAQQRDPQFALAFAAHADAWTLAAIFTIEPPDVAFAQARELAQRSLSVGPDLPDGHAALGHVLTQFDLDFAGGREQYRRALELQPEHAWTHALMALNLTQSSRPAESLRHIRRAQSLEPAAMPLLAIGGWVLYFAGELIEAERQLKPLVESMPGAALPTHFLARVQLARRDWPAALRMLEANNPPGPGSLSNLGRAYAQAGRVAEAQSALAGVEAMGRRGLGVGYDLALLQLELGNRAAAIEALARGLDEHSQMIGYLNVDPALDSLRDEAGFLAVARRIKFG
jgi:tetratricopeptide (TPR) repeat protein